VYRILVGKPEGKKPLGRPRRRWGTLLRWIFRKWDVRALTGSIWLRIGTGGRHFHKKRGSSSIAENQLYSQGLCSMEWAENRIAEYLT
jgi:hypothetical protein